MTRTAALRAQHDSIIDLARQITDAGEVLASTGDAQALQRLLGDFTTILTSHLMSEDRHLYAEMLASDDDRAVAIASRFCEEMGGLTSSHAAFAARWDSAETLMADPAAFNREWSVLLGALAFRIQRENAELYPLADALGDAPERKAG